MILHLVARSRKPRFIERFIEALRQIEGAYALVGLTNKKLVGARDPLGIRPLVLGELDGRYILASETCALDIIGARFVRDVENGEVVVISETGRRKPAAVSAAAGRGPASSNTSTSPAPIRWSTAAPSMRSARPWARELAQREPGRCRCGGAGAGQRRAGGARLRAGLAACPSSSASSATITSGAPSSSRRQSMRELGVRLKHSANRGVVAGKRIVLIDDSVVRGTTSVKIVQMMRDAGAREVHFRIACPPITHPDYYGIDTPEREKLLAAQMDLEGMRAYHGRRFAGLPVGRRHLSGHGPCAGAIRCGRNSPTIASPGDYPTRLTDVLAEFEPQAMGAAGRGELTGAAAHRAVGIALPAIGSTSWNRS